MFRVFRVAIRSHRVGLDEAARPCARDAMFSPEISQMAARSVLFDPQTLVGLGASACKYQELGDMLWRECSGHKSKTLGRADAKFIG
jgi:hypothetical protein